MQRSHIFIPNKDKKTCETKSIKLLTVLISPTAIMICNGMQLDRKFTRIRIVLKTKIFFPPFSLKKIRVHIAYSNHFRPSTRKHWYNGEKITSFTGRMTSAYSKSSVFVHLHKNDKGAFKKNTLCEPVSKTSVFDDQKTSFSCERKAKTEKKISVFKKYPDWILLTNKSWNKCWAPFSRLSQRHCKKRLLANEVAFSQYNFLPLTRDPFLPGLPLP